MRLLSSNKQSTSKNESEDYGHYSEVPDISPTSNAEWVSPFSVLLLLSGMFFLIYVDRGTIASNGVNGDEPSENDSDGSALQGDFELTNLQDGLLSSMFMVGMSVAIPICSEAVYHMNAFRLVGVSLGIWALATFLCGLSFDFYSIAFCRMFVGVGEAAVVSLAPPYIDDHAPPERKTLWLACLFFAVPAGFAGGYGYGALMAATLGWRAAFFIEGFLMLPFVFFCFLAKPLRLSMKTATGLEESDVGVVENRFRSFYRHVSEIFAHRVYIYILGGYISYTALIGVVAYWGAKAAKAVYDLHDMVTAGVAVTMGSLGTVLGGLVLDRMGSSIPKALSLSSFCSFVPGVIMIIGFLIKQPLAIFLMGYSVSLIFLFSLQAPVQAVILWCVPQNHRTLANGLSVLMIHLFGDVPSPPIFGALLDYFKHTKDMNEDVAYLRALCIISSVLILAGVLFLIAARIGVNAIDYRTTTRIEQDPNAAVDSERTSLQDDETEILHSVE